MNNRMPKLKLSYTPNGRRRLGWPLKRLSDEAETGLSRPNIVTDGDSDDDDTDDDDDDDIKKMVMRGWRVLRTFVPKLQCWLKSDNHIGKLDEDVRTFILFTGVRNIL
jgi:hypothetical protein